MCCSWCDFGVECDCVDVEIVFEEYIGCDVCGIFVCVVCENCCWVLVVVGSSWCCDCEFVVCCDDFEYGVVYVWVICDCCVLCDDLFGVSN